MSDPSPAHPLWILPFFVLLLSISLVPLFQPHWWERRYPWVALPLGFLVLGYYIWGIHNPHAVLHVLKDYVSFIALIGSLFIVAGGIHINVKGEATPMVNTVFLFTGSLLSSLIGTTGASMVMIRPWIRMNRHRIRSIHIIFFIFLISNIGGSLTPIGDPPLFLGYLKGIPFFWFTAHLWSAWLFSVAVLLGIFYAMDRIHFKRAVLAGKVPETLHEEWSLEGRLNIAFLGGILGSVFIVRPVFLREALMAAIAFLAFATTRESIRRKNNFSFKPIQEVAVLFLGIFLTMVPCLEWMEQNAHRIGISHPVDFFWATGIFSSILDNAPTYLNFLSIAMGKFCDPAVIREIQNAVGSGFGGSGLHPPASLAVLEVLHRFFSPAALGGSLGLDFIKVATLMAHHASILKAVSLGAVFFGAMTYIGNGPNFLVKSIAEHERIPMASFLGYVFKYSGPILLPLFFLVALIFLRES